MKAKSILTLWTIWICAACTGERGPGGQAGTQGPEGKQGASGQSVVDACPSDGLDAAHIKKVADKSSVTCLYAPKENGQSVVKKYVEAERACFTAGYLGICKKEEVFRSCSIDSSALAIIPVGSWLGDVASDDRYYLTNGNTDCTNFDDVSVDRDTSHTFVCCSTYPIYPN